MDWLIALIICFICLGPLALTYPAHIDLEKRRREALEQVARRLGMSFSAELPEGIRSRLLQAGFGLFKRGGARFYNSMFKRLNDGTEIAIFDYSCKAFRSRPRRGNYYLRRRNYYFSVFWAYCEDLRLPRFWLRPEVPLFDDVAKAFGMQDINFENHPDFSRRYLLRGEDEAKTRLRFHPSFLNFLEQHPPCYAEGFGPQLVIWRDYPRVTPEKMADWLRFGEEWVQRLRLRRV
jgi:hypothetical protein